MCSAVKIQTASESNNTDWCMEVTGITGLENGGSRFPVLNFNTPAVVNVISSRDVTDCIVYQLLVDHLSTLQ